MDGHDDLAAARAYAHALPFIDSESLRIFRRDVDRFAASRRPGIGAGLHTGVVFRQTAPRGQPEWELIVQSIHGQAMFDNCEWRARADYGPLPQPAVEKHFARLRLVGTRPVDATDRFQSRAARATAHRRAARH